MENKLTGDTKVFLFVQENVTPADLELWGLARAFKSCEGRQGFSFLKSAMDRLLKRFGRGAYMLSHITPLPVSLDLI